MTDYSRTPREAPWSKDLRKGDRLNAYQSQGLCHANLRRLGLEVRPDGPDRFIVADARPVTTLADLASGD